jgi:dipeptidyl aminopeptidase/acylaminoacyl peptidase
MALSSMTPFEVIARDGLRLVAFATVPREHDLGHTGVPDHPLPAVIMLGPDPSQRLVWTYNPIHQWLASRGYVVLTTNTRGAGGFGKAFLQAGGRQWGRKMQDDIIDVLKAAIAKGMIDPTKVCIAGLSYGGYAALMGLARDGDLFACGIDVLGPTDLEASAKLIPPQLAQVFSARIGDPSTADGLAALRQVSPQALAGNITKPLLVVQSADRASAEMVTKFVDALVTHKAPVSYLTFPDEQADEIDKPGNSYAMLGVIEAFLSEQLGGPFEPLPPEAMAGTSLTAVVGGERVPGL